MKLHKKTRHIKWRVFLIANYLAAAFLRRRFFGAAAGAAAFLRFFGAAFLAAAFLRFFGAAFFTAAFLRFFGAAFLAAVPFLSLIYGMTVGKYNFKVIRQTLFFPDLPDAFGF